MKKPSPEKTGTAFKLKFCNEIIVLQPSYSNYG
jgi:hypothetical protein